VYSSQERSRDIKIESYSLNYFGRVLIENANIELNFGRRYGLVGANGSGKSTFLHSIAEKDIEIPDHIDVSGSNDDDDDVEREGRG
jgi:ATP-binding cassette subfamily F protein 2